MRIPSMPYLVLALFCFVIAFTGSGKSQQVMARVNAAVANAATSSTVQSRITTNTSTGSIQDIGHRSRGAGGGNMSGLMPLGVSVKLPGKGSSSCTGHEFGSSSTSGAGMNTSAIPASCRTVFMMKNNEISSNTLHVSQSNGGFGGGSVAYGSFPDSTRENVPPSPYLTGNSLQFFTAKLPQFTASFSSIRHLNPSYAVSISSQNMSKSQKFGNSGRQSATGLKTSGVSIGSLPGFSDIKDPLMSSSISIKDPLNSSLDLNHPK